MEATGDLIAVGRKMGQRAASARFRQNHQTPNPQSRTNSITPAVIRLALAASLSRVGFKAPARSEGACELGFSTGATNR